MKILFCGRHLQRIATHSCLVGVLCSAWGSSVLAGSFFDDPFGTSKAVPSYSSRLTFSHKNGCNFEQPLPKPLELIDALERSLCQNPQTLQTWAAIKQQAAAIGVQNAAYLPTASVTGNWADASKYINSPGYAQHDYGFTTHSTDLNLNINWVLYDFGLRSSNLENAKQLFNAALASHDVELLTVFQDAMQNYCQAQANEALLAATIDAEHSAEENFRAADAKYKIGVGTLADKLQAQTSLAQATLKRSQASSNLQNSIGALAMSMGYKPNIVINLPALEDKVPNINSIVKSIDVLIDDAIRMHPKILTAKAQILAARSEYDTAVAINRPTISLFTSLERSGAPIVQVSAGEVIKTRNIGIQISVPIFDGFSSKYKSRAAQAKIEFAQYELKGAEQKVANEVWVNYQNFLAELSNLETTEILIQSATQSFEVSKGRYKAGIGNILELLKAQSDLSDAKQQRILALAKWKIARYNLAISLGALPEIY
ncbi:TolC family protein [Undibacterium sp. 14-3-2]|uniref:TolC family protein n=1 Tax=Undibacterium sp. 14-3-2 TaxID=2800129 RepID=UPI00190717EE|nr:TolC family protein [Undibacterium sp. 14-3-2]MBK1889316.1 TolC family protein [Undibacterium sp. 14-3-2]